MVVLAGEQRCGVIKTQPAHLVNLRRGHEGAVQRMQVPTR
jgi:hypothetical protein